MKGTILRCAQELVQEKFGQDKWEAILEKCGYPKDRLFMVLEDVPDDKTLQLFATTGEVLGVTHEQLCDVYGEYWCVTYAPARYPMYYKGKTNAKEMILDMDNVHTKVTKAMNNSRPPKFTYTWKDDATLEMGYNSPRGLIHLLAGLARGVGKHFGEDLTVTVNGTQSITVKFP